MSEIALLGKKIGMTREFYKSGQLVPVTVLKVQKARVIQVIEEEKRGYKAIQLGYGEKKAKNAGKALTGHFAKAKTTPKVKVQEFDGFETELNLGDVVDVELFVEGEYVDVTGVSKGKGFQGVVKRHGFRGVGDATHGQHNRLRAPGSIGAASYPARVFKGMRMAGRMGGDQVTVANLQVLKVIKDKNLLVVKGSVPGPKNSLLTIEK